MSPTTLFTNYDSEKLFDELTIPNDIFYIFCGLIAMSCFSLALFSRYWCKDQDDEDEGEDECECECEGDSECEDEDDSFVIFPDTLKVSDDGDTYVFDKYRVSFMEDRTLQVITGKTLKKLEKKERREERKEARQREKEEREAELMRVANETQLQDTVARLNAILENYSVDEYRMRRRAKSYARPLDYGHRYLQDCDQLTSTLRGITVDVLYRKGASAKDDRYIAVFNGTNDTFVFNSLNKVAAELARRVEINGPNAWTAFKRVKPNGELESIERLDIIE